MNRLAFLSALLAVQVLAKTNPRGNGSKRSQGKKWNNENGQEVDQQLTSVTGNPALGSPQAIPEPVGGKQGAASEQEDVFGEDV